MPVTFSPGLAFCLCDHEQRAHLVEPNGLGAYVFTICEARVEGTHALGYPARRRRCPCARFVEAEFARQQVPMFEGMA